MTIKPGSLCRIVCNHRPGHRDRIVAAHEHTIFFGHECWYVTAGWLMTAIPMSPGCLRPISDPDIDLAQTTDEGVAA